MKHHSHEIVLDDMPRQPDIEFFNETGYWISPPLFTKEELVVTRDHYFRVLNGTYETGIAPYKRDFEPGETAEGVTKITNCVWSDSTLSRLILDERLGRIACRLLGSRAIRYWRDHLWFKVPRSGQQGVVGWHQDHFYWQCAEPASIITAWIALDDVNEENGCLEMLPGSHVIGLLAAGDLYSKDLDHLQRLIEPQLGKLFSPVPCVMKAGCVSFHHCLTVHGSRPNLSDKPRLSISVHYIPEGTRYRAGRSIKPFSNEQLLSGNDGDLFVGPYFPVVYREGHLSNPWDTDQLD